MKYLLPVFLSLSLSACFGPNTFDASSKESVEQSAELMSKDLPESDKEDLKNAIIYYSMGGENGLEQLMTSQFSNNNEKIDSESFVYKNLEAINGLTAEEILNQYRAEQAKLKAKREAQEAERKAKREAEAAKREAEAAKRKAEEEERAQVLALKEKAESLLESNEFQKAMATYEQLSDLSMGKEAAKEGIAATEHALQSFTEKMNYLDKVSVTEFVATRIDTYKDEDVPAIRISLKNVGNRTLNKVKAVVYFKDKNDKTIFEKEYHPVLVTEYSFRNNDPLKPGYVREMEKGKYYTLDSQLTEWEEGNASLKIVDIEFGD